MPGNDPETVAVEFQFYATFREAVGRKAVTRDLPAGATLGDALADLADEYPDLRGEILREDETERPDEGDVGRPSEDETERPDEEGVELRDGVRALRNGREAVDAAARLEDGDEVSFMTPIHGG